MRGQVAHHLRRCVAPVFDDDVSTQADLFVLRGLAADDGTNHAPSTCRTDLRHLLRARHRNDVVLKPRQGELARQRPQVRRVFIGVDVDQLRDGQLLARSSVLPASLLPDCPWTTSLLRRRMAAARGA
jgi:hypothetical protein